MTGGWTIRNVGPETNAGGAVNRMTAPNPAAQALARRRWSRPRPVHACTVCGDPTVRKYCGAECKNRAKYQRRKARKEAEGSEMNDRILDDMWNWDQCRDLAYRCDRRQVSAWLNNNAWTGVVRILDLAPWTWTRRARFRD